MAYPEHPDTVLIKNKFYPKGLTELDIWNYYQNNKLNILEEVRNRDLFFYIAVDLNKFIIKRKGKNTKFIRLTPQTYDDYIHGRVVSIHSTMKKVESFGIIDIDTDDFRKAKLAAFDVYEEALKFELIDSVEIRYSGKQSFHIVCNFIKPIIIDKIREYLRYKLNEAKLYTKYTIEYKRTTRVPNLDLSPNKYRGGYITKGSLSIWGLKCMEVSINDLSIFNQNHARIL